MGAIEALRALLRKGCGWGHSLHIASLDVEGFLTSSRLGLWSRPCSTTMPQLGPLPQCSGSSWVSILGRRLQG